jgi:preprotein translocase subunit SecG
MHLTILSLLINSTSSPDYAFQLVTAILAGVTVLLTGIYVAATLALVAITNKQSKNTLAASAKQSQDAIDAVHDQIIASEKQSQAAIDAIHKQIEENRNQTVETIYNQHRPILVCSYHPVEDTLLSRVPLPIKNVGVGIALNIRVVLSYVSTDAGEKLQKSERESPRD